jgi:transcription antitermination factor NusG
MKKMIFGSKPVVSTFAPSRGISLMHRERLVIRDVSPEQQPDLQWYALCVRSRFERVVSEHLRCQGYAEYLPTYRVRRRWSDRVKQVEKALFPGYIFCKFDPMKRLPILMIPGVVSMVSFAGRATAVPEEEILAVQSVVNSGLAYEPCSFLNVGQRVRIDRGPLCGLEGFVIETKNDWRFIISVSLLQRSVSVEIERDCVTPIKTTYPTLIKTTIGTT